ERSPYQLSRPNPLWSPWQPLARNVRRYLPRSAAPLARVDRITAMDAAIRSMLAVAATAMSGTDCRHPVARCTDRTPRTVRSVARHRVAIAMAAVSALDAGV